jgi:hypothetical protein
MQPISSTAVRAAVLLTALTGACNDAPLAPHDRSPNIPPASLAQSGRIQVFSDARADSVMNELEAGWARHGHPEYRRARLAWRRANGVPDSIGDYRLPDPAVMRPNAELMEGDGTGLRPPPQILSHYEALHFGHVDKYMNVPSGIEAEITFIGDQGEIQVGSATITGNNGSTYPATGRVAVGPGQLINCADALFGNCENRRHLGGVMILDGAPTCDAKGSGTVNYYVANINPPISVALGPVSTGSAGNLQDNVAANAYISNTAPPCAAGEDDGGQHTDSTDAAPVTGGNGGSGPPPVYDGPGVPPLPPSYPPPRIDGAPEDFWCERVDTYVYVGGVRTLFETAYECYRAN